MKKNLALVYNTHGPGRAEEEEHQPRHQQFKQAVELNPKLAEARLNLAALSLNNRDYKTAEENFQAVLQHAAQELRGRHRPGRRAAREQEDRRGRGAVQAAQKLDPSNPWSYFNLGLLYQDYKDGEKPSLQKAQDYYRQFLAKATGRTPDSLKREAEKRIKDIDEIYVALDEAAKMQAEAEEMQKKAEEQQKKMEEEMKKQEAEEAAAKAKADASKSGGDKGRRQGRRRW